MSDHPQIGRRQALKFLSAGPLLPLGSISIASMLTACGGSNSNNSSTTPEVPPTVSFVSATFSSMAAPTLANAAAMATTTVGSTLSVTMSDKSVKDYKLSYQPFFVTGDMVPDGAGGKVLAGAYYDINNKPIMDNSVAGKERHIFLMHQTALPCYRWQILLSLASKARQYLQ